MKWLLNPQVAAHLRILLEKSTGWHWTHQQESSFQELKRLITNPPVLKNSQAYLLMTAPEEWEQSYFKMRIPLHVPDNQLCPNRKGDACDCLWVHKIPRPHLRLCNIASGHDTETCSFGWCVVYCSLDYVCLIKLHKHEAITLCCIKQTTITWHLMLCAIVSIDMHGMQISLLWSNQPRL